MSDKMTAVHIPGVTAGFADWGDQDPADMIRRLRRQAVKQRDEAQAILDRSDAEFVVETYRGPVAQSGRKQIWPAL